MSGPDRPAVCVLLPATASSPGAIAILQLIGEVEPVLRRLTGRSSWPVAAAGTASLGGIDLGLVARPAPDVAQVMPHGGPRVVQRLVERLVECGAEPVNSIDEVPAEALFPEAADAVEALTLAALARAASPLAVDLLLDQPRRFRSNPNPDAEDLQRSRRLDRLIEPPRVALAGPANVGKSTLSNALLGRCMSIEADQPGTTRDYTWGRIDLAGLVVDFHDTPGLRAESDQVERRAVDLARDLLQNAALVIALTDHFQDWPTLDRPADLRVANKCDLARRNDADLSVSARTGEGIEQLVRTIRDRLVPPEDLEHPGPWVFDDRLGDRRSPCADV